MNPLLPPLLLFLSSLLTLTIADDSLSPGQSINTTQSLVSASGFFKLGFFAPGDGKRQYLGIWYNKIPVQTVVWVANRQSPLPESGGVLKVANNGSGLLLSDAAGTSIPWSISAANAGKPVARLLDTGNFVLLDEEDGTYLWQSFDHPTDALLPGMKLGVDKKTGLDRRLTSWKSPDDPAAGAYFMALDVSGVPEVYLADSSSSWTWRSGPWNGRRFSGIPEMQSYDMFSLAFVANETEDYYSFYTTNTSIVSRLLVNHTGQVQRLVWVERAGTWNTFWFAPKDPCDAVSPCGPYGVCDTNDSPMCNCLQGFTPKSPQDWYLRVGSDGCVRKTVLDCSNGTDGFVTISGAKLPDTSKASADMGMGLEECRQACARNCSCTAYAAADISGGGSGSGCILWFSHLTDLRVYANGGQDLFVRLAATDLGSGSSTFHKSKAWIIGVVLALGLVLIGCWIGWLVRSRRKRRKESLHTTTSISGNYSAENSGPVRDLELPLFEFSAMAAATDSFSVENKLGEGGFGPVYKGKLEDGKEVAIKRLSRNSVQGADEFRNEVMLIAKLQHRNLVRLLGCCTEGEERMLIYEYMPNTGLDAFLFDKEKGNLLDWKTRYRIIMGIARGLLYLHQDSRFRIIHRDLKASNILLDQDMNPRISDFGMARIFGGDETEANTIKVVGTYGYMAPEYALDGVFSMKSDVFSFGVLVLEIISGKRNRGHYFSDPLQNLVRHTWSLWKEGNSLEIIDKSIVHAFPISEALKCIKIGLLCVQEHPEDRPTMSSVVLMLGSDNALLPQPRHPGYIMTRGPMELYSSSGQQESCSINDITVTTFQGR